MSITRTISPRSAAAAGMLGLALAIVAAVPRPAAEVQVILTDYKIQMSNTLQPGPTTFNIRNNGQVEHGFAIRSTSAGTGAQPGVPPMDVAKDVAKLESNLAPGASARLEANLAPGTYEVLDPVKDHKDRGMSLRVKVQDRAIP